MLLKETVENLRLMDIYTLLYYRFLTREDRKVYRPHIVAITKKYELVRDTMQRMSDIQTSLAEDYQTRTQSGKDRASKILKVLYHERELSEIEVI